jgi:hypothetical protein
MIRRCIATDKGVAKLNAEETAIFCMLIPHLSAYGKMRGSAEYIKEVCLPLAPWATISCIESAMNAIHQHTKVKRFKGKDGLWYIHAVRFEKHQSLEKTKRGGDLLPDYPRIKSPTKSTTKSTTTFPEVDDLVAAEVEVEVEGEFEVKEEGKEKEEVKDAGARIAPSGGASAPVSHSKAGNFLSPPPGKYADAGETIQTEPGNGKSTLMPPKEVGLNECLSRFRSGEWNLLKVSEKLHLYGFSSAEINSPKILQLFVAPEAEEATQ